MQTKLDHILTASTNADMANTSMSRHVSNYWMANHIYDNSVENTHIQHVLMHDRLSDAPPTALIDTESYLNNRFDVLGRSGYVYRRSGNYTDDHIQISNPNTQDINNSANKSNEFFQQVSGRDYHKQDGLINMYRQDVIISNYRPLGRQAYVDTRQLTKDKLKKCHD